MKIHGQIHGQTGLRIGMESGTVNTESMLGQTKNPILLLMTAIIASLSSGQIKMTFLKILLFHLMNTGVVLV